MNDEQVLERADVLSMMDNVKGHMMDRNGMVKRLWARKVEGLHKMVDRMPTGMKKASMRAKVWRLEDRSLVTDMSTSHEVRMTLLKDFHILHDLIFSNRNG